MYRSSATRALTSSLRSLRPSPSSSSSTVPFHPSYRTLSTLRATTPSFLATTRTNKLSVSGHVNNARWSSTTAPLMASQSGVEMAPQERPAIDLGRLGGMQALTPEDLHELRTKTGKFNVLFIGAGNINFGSDEGPWNHSVRLEHKLQTRMNVVGVIDPDVNRAKAVLAVKCASFVESAYKNARVERSLEDWVKNMKSMEEVPEAVVVGSPPQFHGSDVPGQDLELSLIDAFGPQVALFVEKPISCSAVPSTYALATKLEKYGTVASVGYMLRYLQVIQKMRQIIEESGKPVQLVAARYISSYARVHSQVFWTKSKSMGPIVEQGTHFVDLCRYFGGEALLDTVQATSTEHYEANGHLEAMPIDESAIPEHERIPRNTSAIWKCEGGAVCSFTHALTLQGKKYETQLEVYLDGWQLRAVDLYNEPTLYVRSPESDAEQRINFPNDDPYYGEISAWIDAAEAKEAIDLDRYRAAKAKAAADNQDHHDSGASVAASYEPLPTNSGILSSFRDACGTYALTWAIAEASEKAKKTPKVDH